MKQVFILQKMFWYLWHFIWKLLCYHVICHQLRSYRRVVVVVVFCARGLFNSRTTFVVWWRHRLVTVTSTCNLTNRDQLFAKVPKYSRHLVAKLWLFVNMGKAKLWSVDPTLRRLEGTFLQKYTQHDVNVTWTWREYSLQAQPVDDVWVFDG